MARTGGRRAKTRGGGGVAKGWRRGARVISAVLAAARGGGVSKAALSAVKIAQNLGSVAAWRRKSAANGGRQAGRLAAVESRRRAWHGCGSEA